MPKIYIDQGHNPDPPNTGAEGNGLREQDITYEVGQRLAALLRRSGNYEVALTRLESRVGSAMMSDVTRGLVSVIRGDKTDVYWGNLVLKFSDYQRTLLKNEANKAPKRVRKLSMALLFCFMLVYVAVIGQVLISSLGGMFG